MKKIILFILLLSINSIAEERSRLVVIDHGLYSGSIEPSVFCEDADIEFDVSQIGVSHIEKVTMAALEFTDIKNNCIHPFQTTYSGNLEVFSIWSLYQVRSLKNVKSINISMSGDPPDSIASAKIELDLYVELMKSGVDIFVSAGNSKQVLSEDNCLVFPACYKTLLRGAISQKFIVVVSYDSPRHPSFFTNLAEFESYMEDGWVSGSFGTSFSSPRAMGKKSSYMSLSIAPMLYDVLEMSCEYDPYLTQYGEVALSIDKNNLASN